MGKASCCWCDGDFGQSSSGLFWIHPECFNKIMDISGDLKVVKEILLGEHSRNKLESERNWTKEQVIIDFIEDMEKFRIQFDGITKIMKELNSPKETNE